MNQKLKYVIRLFLGLSTEEKEVLNPGVIGFYDCKPYDNFHYAMIYAKENEVYNDGDVEIWTRTYKGTTFVNVLVNNESGFDWTQYDYEHTKPRLQEKGLEATDKSVTFVAFCHNNENTIGFCKKLCKSDKKNFLQAGVYNPKTVHIDYYKPVPKFWKLYDHFCEDLYFDWAFIDPDRE